MRTFALLFACLIPASALAAPLTVQPFVASPNGFLVTSSLISGEHDAILVDAQFTLADAHRLVATVIESKKTLKTVFITHAHPDHFFGLEVIKAAFPATEIVATQAVIDEIKVLAPQKVAQWKPIYGDNLTSNPITPKVLAADHLDLEGQRVELVPLATAESAAASAVWVPSAKTLITGDAAFHDVHVWLVDVDAARRNAWLKNLEQLKALHPERVIAGHEGTPSKGAAALDETIAYIRDFEAALTKSKKPDDLVRAINGKHGKAQLPIVLELSAKSALAGK